MSEKPTPQDDPSSAPESGTVRNETSGPNTTAPADERGANVGGGEKENPANANEQK